MLGLLLFNAWLNRTIEKSSKNSNKVVIKKIKKYKRVILLKVTKLNRKQDIF